MYDDIAIAVVFSIAAIMLKTWLSHRERMKGLSITKQGSSPSDERLARVEQAVESIAIEVERIGEAQRFTTKLLSERAPEPAAGRIAPVQSARREPGTITPH
jgi:hypothetical protein